LWKVSIDGGEAVKLINELSVQPTVSPDGKLIVFVGHDPESHRFGPAVISIDGGEITFPSGFPADTNPIGQSRFEWTHDGHGLTYVLTRNGVSIKRTALQLRLDSLARRV
jgi:Tol biopolymer transport system component